MNSLIWIIVATFVLSQVTCKPLPDKEAARDKVHIHIPYIGKFSRNRQNFRGLVPFTNKFSRMAF